MRALFVLNNPGMLRYFDVTVQELLARGHEVSLAFTRPDIRAEVLDALEDFPLRPEVLGAAPERTDVFAPVAYGLRAAVDFVRYLDPRFSRAEFLRNRRRVKALEFAPATRWLASVRTLPGPLARWLVAALLLLERAVPSSREVERFLAGADPDVVLLSPLVTGASPQTDYVKSARALGVPSALCVASWDNLTNKGLIRVAPDRVVVWNEAQAGEAVALHGVPREHVVVTGAQPFDRWFGRGPAKDRDAFCREVGLPGDEPYVLFAGSTSNIAKTDLEETFVRSWVEALRRHEGAAALGIMVRPHPERPGRWDAVDLAGARDAVLWPPRRPNDVAAGGRADYFESIYHAAAVVGINTSAMIEAAVIGRPVLTVRAPEFAEAQEGTLHFSYLLPENGGFVREARDLDEHVRQLVEAVREPERARADNERFVRAFVRPQGLGEPSTPRLVEAITDLAASGRVPAAGVPAPLAPLTLALGLLGRHAIRSERRRQPEAVRDRARRVSGPLKGLAVRTRPVAPLSRLLGGLGATVERRGKEKSSRIKDETDRRKRRQLEAKDVRLAGVPTAADVD